MAKFLVQRSPGTQRLLRASAAFQGYLNTVNMPATTATTKLKFGKLENKV